MSTIAVVIYYIVVWFISFFLFTYKDNMSLLLAIGFILFFLVLPYIYVGINNFAGLWKNIKSMRYNLLICQLLSLFFVWSIILVKILAYKSEYITDLFFLFGFLPGLMPTLLGAILFIYINTKLLKNNN